MDQNRDFGKDSLVLQISCTCYFYPFCVTLWWLEKDQKPKNQTGFLLICKESKEVWQKQCFTSKVLQIVYHRMPFGAHLETTGAKGASL